VTIKCKKINTRSGKHHCLTALLRLQCAVTMFMCLWLWVYAQCYG